MQKYTWEPAEEEIDEEEGGFALIGDPVESD